MSDNPLPTESLSIPPEDQKLLPISATLQMFSFSVSLGVETWSGLKEKCLREYFKSHHRTISSNIKLVERMSWNKFQNYSSWLLYLRNQQSPLQASISKSTAILYWYQCRINNIIFCLILLCLLIFVLVKSGIQISFYVFLLNM